MYTTYFIIPKAVYFYCILPAVLIIIAAILFTIIYHRKKGTYYYVYTVNYVYNIGSILLCSLLLPLLIGYSLAIGYIIYKKLIIDVGFLLIIALIILPIIPLATLIIVCNKFVKNLKYKELLDENAEVVVEEQNKLVEENVNSELA